MRWCTLNSATTVVAWSDLCKLLTRMWYCWHHHRVLFFDPSWALYLWSLPSASLWISLPLFNPYGTLLSTTCLLLKQKWCLMEKPRCSVVGSLISLPEWQQIHICPSSLWGQLSSQAPAPPAILFSLPLVLSLSLICHKRTWCKLQQFLKMQNWSTDEWVMKIWYTIQRMNKTNYWYMLQHAWTSKTLY